MRLVPLSPSHVVVVLLLFLHMPTEEALIRAVYNHNGISQDFDALPSDFGPPLDREGLLGHVVAASPANACTAIEAPPPANESFVASIALIRGHGCPFVTKVLHAQQAGYQAAIVHNVYTQALTAMASCDEDAARRVKIPSLLMAESASTQLKRIFHYDQTAYVILVPECHWLSCWSSTSAWHPTPLLPKHSLADRSVPCLPAQCCFLRNIHRLLFYLALVIWVAALYVLCCL